MPITRGFFRKRPESPAGRLPPGQYDVGAGWPVLTAEATPRVPLDSWTLSVDGLVDTPTTWTWDEVQLLPRATYTGDITVSLPGRSSTSRSPGSAWTTCWPRRDLRATPSS
jgi:hypothetical protein